jgi:hypothetical protein
MEQSILKSVKKAVGIGDDDESFDLDILMHINSEFSNLCDMGVGPEEGFVVEDDSLEWGDFLDAEEERVKLSKVKMAVILRTRLLFDPPTTSFLLDALKAQLQEMEWRLNVNREHEAWEDPNPPVIPVVEEVE